MQNQIFGGFSKAFLPNYLSSSTAIAAVLAAVSGLCASAPQAQAQGLFWTERPYYYEPQDRVKPRQQTRRAKRSYPRVAAEPKKSDPKPEGPLLIAVSIEKQRLKIYDANGVWAESPISSGTRSNPTPMGVFSIIQKNKWHRSNLYSGAPMPYMQRITWSGVALHAGVLPGYPASHGCIRLPGDFAARLWGWTKLGARVVVTPGETTPADITHAKLIAKIITQPTEQPAAAPVAGAPGSEPSKSASGTEPPAVTPEKPADNPAPAEKRTENELRLRTVHDESTGPGKSGAVDMIRTADASGTALLPVAVLADATDAAPTSPAVTPASAAETQASEKTDTAKADASDASPASKDADNKKDAADKTAADKTVSDKPAADNTAADKTAAETKPAESAASPHEAHKPAAADSASSTDKDKAAAATADKPAAPADTASVDKPKTDVATKADVSKADKPAEKKAEPAAKKRTGHVAAFVSRKEGKLFVRQGFDAWFDVPVTIDDPSRPLGTHVFTAHKAGTSDSELRWTVITVPPRRVDATDQSARRRGKQAVKAEPAPPPQPSSTASEALDRITIPQESMDRIAEAIGAGGSLTISDQGLGPETGKGTDFIVLAR